MSMLRRWLSRTAFDAGLFGKLFPRERITTYAFRAERANSKKSGSVYPGTERSQKIWLRRSMRMETKYYLVFGVVGIAIASMVRTLSEARGKVQHKPTEE
jgi:hypothetical protein